MSPPRISSRSPSGFTLIEVLVALSVLALMAVISWRGIDTMARALEQTRTHADAVQTLQTGLAQWSTDLDNVLALPGGQGIDWDGRVLRLTRRSTDLLADGLWVVGWTRRVQDGRGVWLRWQSPALRTRGELDQAWQQVAHWGQNPGQAERARELAILPVEQWQIYFFRNDTWSNPLSASGAATPVAGAAHGGTGAALTGAVDPGLILGVRLVLTLPPSAPVSGALTRDWVRPTQGGGK